MICLACRGLSGGRLCGRCAAALRPASDRWVEPGVLVRSAFLHDGPARQLVHRLKYDGVASAARVLAGSMAPLVAGASALVPVPRTVVRRHRFGIDPGAELAAALAALTGIGVVAALRPEIVAHARAGRAREDRREPAFRVRGVIPSGAVLIDDVITTGSTLRHVAGLTGIVRAVTATSRILDSSWTRDRPKDQ
jgi:predicted amidophosphoribosyltransferase